MDNSDRLFALYTAHLACILKSRAMEARQLHEGNTSFSDCDAHALRRAKQSLAAFEAALAEGEDTNA